MNKRLISALFSWLGKPNPTQLNDADQIEQFLTRQLSPVEPRPAYVNGLGKRLSDQSQQIEVHQPSRDFGGREKTLMIAVGILTGFLLITYVMKQIVCLSDSRPASQSLSS